MSLQRVCIFPSIYARFVALYPVVYCPQAPQRGAAAPVPVMLCAFLAHAALGQLEALQRRLDSGQDFQVDGPRRSRPFDRGGHRAAPGRERRCGPRPGWVAGARVRPCGQPACGLAGFRDDRPGDLGGRCVLERVPAAPVAELLDDQQAAPALVVRAWLRGQGDAGVVVADEDGQLALVEGEDQPMPAGPGRRRRSGNWSPARWPRARRRRPVRPRPIPRGSRGSRRGRSAAR